MIDLGSGSLVVAYVTYAIGIATPGPAILCVTNSSLRGGFRSGELVAAGIVVGSIGWGLAAALGLSALIEVRPEVIGYFKIFGGLYLLCLGWRALRSKQRGLPVERDQAEPDRLAKKEFLRGLGLHLTNPKAVFVWTSVISIALSDSDGSALRPLLVVAGSAPIAITIFGGYALLFSRDSVRNAYFDRASLIDKVVAVVYGFIGFGLLVG